MIKDTKSCESDFMSWLSAKGLPTQSSQLRWCYSEIESACINANILHSPLFETTDVETICSVQQFIEQSKMFRIRHFRQFSKLVSAGRFYLTYIKERAAQKAATEVPAPASAKIVEEAAPPAEAIPVPLPERDPTQGDDSQAETSAADQTADEAMIAPAICAEEGEGHTQKSTDSKNRDSVIEQPKKALRPHFTVSRSSFYDYLLNVKKFSQTTSWSYASVIGDCETLAKEHHYTSWRLYTPDIAEAKATADVLLSNSDFIAYNNRMSNQPKTAIEMLLVFIRGDETAESSMAMPDEPILPSSDDKNAAASVSEVVADAPEATSEKTNRLRLIEWLGKRGVSSGDVFVILSALNRCTERVRAEKIIDDDIYHITSAETMDAVRSFLLADRDFINVDRIKGNRLINALNLYSEFFEEQVSPQAVEAIAEPEPEADASAGEVEPTASEIDTLLSEEIFSPLKLALANENIRTIEELKTLKLWAFMNQNNLYSISMRQTVLVKVRQLLEPEATESPELLYELHCGETVYSGDTIAKTFLHFCEDTAKKYPLFFRSLLNKTIGRTSNVKIYRCPENGNFIRMENPTCYVSADLAKDSVIAAVEWILQRCTSAVIPVSIKEPNTLLGQSAYTETPQEELLDTEKLPDPMLYEQRLDLAENRSLAYTKPTGLSYKGKAISCTSWSELYVKLVRELYSDYESLFQHDMHFTGSSRVDLGNRTRMTHPRAIRGNVYLECNVSATGIVSKIRWLLDYCSVNTDDIIITYHRQGGGTTPQASQLEHSTAHAAPVHSVSSQESESVNSEQIAKVEKIVLDADMNGVTYDSLYNALRLTMVATKALVQQCKRIVEIKSKLYHEDAFIDWDDGARRLCLIIEKLMQKNNGYISAAQLYDYARVEMNMFLNDNGMNDERAVYEIAQHLFEKNGFEGHYYIFTGKTHISTSEVMISSNFDIICKFAADQGGIFREDDLADYLAGLGIHIGNLRNQMRLNKEPVFFFYEPGTIISAKSMRINDSWKESVMRTLNNLLNDADNHIVLRQIQPVWYESLPALPGHRRWTPLLLQFVLHFYGKEFGAKTIMAMESQSMDTLHALLVKADSPIQNFGDAVIAYLIESETEQRSFEAEELRQLLVKTGMIQGNELIWNMPKALAKDERFAWDAKGENVTVRV